LTHFHNLFHVQTFFFLMSEIFQKGTKLNDKENYSEKPIKSNRVNCCDINDKTFFIIAAFFHNLIPNIFPEVWFYYTFGLSYPKKNLLNFKFETNFPSHFVIAQHTISHNINGLITKLIPNLLLFFSMSVPFEN
jgi:hypothetical protein